MADHELIDDYLAELSRRLAWSPDRDDAVAEAEDHLMCAVEQLVADGTEPHDAQRIVLQRFGQTNAVAAAHASTGRGGIAMPTRFTRLAGFAAIAAAILWVVMAGAQLVGYLVDPQGSAETAIALVAFGCLVGAAAMTTLVVVGLNQRHGGLGPLGVIGLALVGLGLVATLMFWFVMGWGTLLATGMLLIAIAIRARGLAPRGATLAFGSAWFVAVSVWSVLRVLEVGTRDEWGDYPVVAPVAIVVGALILLPGLIGLGRWLSTERPEDLDATESLAAT